MQRLVFFIGEDLGPELDDRMSQMNQSSRLSHSFISFRVQQQQVEFTYGREYFRSSVAVAVAVIKG